MPKHLPLPLRLAAPMLMMVSALAQAEDAPLSPIELQARETKAVAEAQAAVNAAKLPAASDFSKYKLDAPELQLEATAARLAFAEANQLAGTLADRIAEASGCTGGANLVLVSPRLRVLLMRAQALPHEMDSTRASLQNLTLALDNETDKASAIEAKLKPEPGGKKIKLLGGTALLPAIASIGELGIGLAYAMRSAYKATTVDNKAMIDAAFGNLVQGKLASKRQGCRLLHAEAMLSPAMNTQSPVYQSQQQLVDANAAAQRAIQRALEKAAALRRAAPPAGPDDESPESKLRQRVLDAADALTAAATKHQGQSDTVAKALADMTMPDADGNSPLDEALRGNDLRELMTEASRLVSVTLISSKADVVAKDGFFTGLKVGVASHTTATWQLFNLQGRVVAAGSEAAATQAQRVMKDLFD